MSQFREFLSVGRWMVGVLDAWFRSRRSGTGFRTNRAVGCPLCLSGRYVLRWCGGCLPCAGRGPITQQVRSAADVLGVRERAVWRWLAAAAESDEAAAAGSGARPRDTGFTITPEVRGLLALWKGNVAAVHRELTARAARGEGAPPPSLTTLHRAIRRDLSPGSGPGSPVVSVRPGKHDVFLARPRGWRNQVWETDHVQALVLVDVEGGVDITGERGVEAICFAGPGGSGCLRAWVPLL